MRQQLHNVLPITVSKNEDDMDPGAGEEHHQHGSSTRGVGKEYLVSLESLRMELEAVPMVME